MHDQVRGSDRGPKGDPDGGGPVGIGSHMAPPSKGLHNLGRQSSMGFSFDIRQWWGPRDDQITDLVRSSGRTQRGDHRDGGPV